ncbi:MAG TPA: 2Fe-2S iron-sulfur cluster-binding protein, partial [bacterium]|nr:2Fe-2S iron-sulfur cluster-binding protein [bacterium]
FCTPGFIMTSTAFLERHPDVSQVTRDEIRHAIAGNLCRCTGYQGIIDAVEYAARQLAAGQWPPTEGQRQSGPHPMGSIGTTPGMG